MTHACSDEARDQMFGKKRERGNSQTLERA